jgi:hypothetical protein
MSLYISWFSLKSSILERKFKGWVSSFSSVNQLHITEVLFMDYHLKFYIPNLGQMWMVFILSYYVWKQSSICELKNSIVNIVCTEHYELWQNVILISVVFKLYCSQRFGVTNCICLQPTSLLRATATQVVVGILAIFIAGILSSVQPFSVSWKLLYQTRHHFVQNVVAYHTVILLSILKSNLVNCQVFELAEPLSHSIAYDQLMSMDASLWLCIMIACTDAMQSPSKVMISINSHDLKTMQPRCDWLFWLTVSINYLDLDRSSRSIIWSIATIDYCNWLAQLIILIGCNHHHDWSFKLFVRSVSWLCNQCCYYAQPHRAPTLLGAMFSCG